MTSIWQRAKKKFVPRPAQLEGIKLIVRGEGARLFMYPGAGKSATVLKAFDLLRSKGYVDRMLVIAPLRVIMTSWPDQLESWEDFSHLTYKIVHGDRAEALRSSADILLINPEGILSKEWAASTKLFRDGNWMLVVDEATAFANSGSKRFKLLKKMLPFFTYNTVLTGTPKAGALDRLFSICYITDEGRDLGGYITHFRRQYMQPSYSGFGFDEQPGAAARVAEKIQPTTLQLEYNPATTSEVVQIWVQMPDHVKTFYDELKKEFLAVLGDDVVVAPTAASVLNKLRQVAQGAIYNEDGVLEVHGAKLDALENLLAELDGKPLFCLTQFKHDIARISARLGYQVPYMGSGTSASQGAAHCQSFSAGDIPLLCGHPLSISKGVDGLQQNCHHICWFGLDWSWENYFQANLRVVRHGNDHHVIIYQILADCGVERAMMMAVEGKKKSEEEFCKLLRNQL